MHPDEFLHQSIVESLMISFQMVMRDSRKKHILMDRDSESQFDLTGNLEHPHIGLRCFKDFETIISVTP